MQEFKDLGAGGIKLTKQQALDILMNINIEQFSNSEKAEALHIAKYVLADRIRQEDEDKMYLYPFQVSDHCNYCPTNPLNGGSGCCEC